MADRGQKDLDAKQASEEGLRLLAATVAQRSEGIAIVDLEARVLFVNRALARMHGYSEEEMLGKHVSAFHTPEQMLAVDAAIEQVRETGEFRGELWHLRRDGTVFPALRHVTVLRDDTGLPVAMVGTVRDITQDKAAREALQESESRYRSLFEQAADAVVLIDTETRRLVEFNQKAHENLGYTREEFKNLRIPDLEVIESEEQVAEHAAKIVKEGGDIFETKHRTKTGEIRDVLVNSRTLTLGSKTLLQSIWRDVTEQRQAERRLAQSREMSELLLNASSDLVYLTDTEGNVLTANQAGAASIGTTPDKLFGRNVFDFFPPDVGELRKRSRDVVVRSREPMRFQDERLGKVFDIRLYPIVGGAGEIDRIAVFVTDVTDLRRAENALRESERRYRTIFESSAEGILIANVETKAIRHANPAICRMLGYTLQELERLCVTDIHPKDSLDDALSAFEATARGEIDFAPGVPCLRKDGTVFYADIIGSPFIIDGTRCNVGFFTDVTLRTRAEEETRKFKTITDQASYGAAVSDLEGNLVYVNESLAEMHGGLSEDFIGRNLSTFHNEEQRARVDLLNERLRREGRFTAEEVWHARLDGTVFPTLMNAAVITDARGRPSFLSATAIDISERVQAQEETRKFKTLTDQASYGAALADVEGVLLYVNDAWAAMYGTGPEYFIGRHLSVSHNEEQKAISAGLVERLKREGQIVAQEVWHARPDGTVFPTLMSAAVITEASGRPCYLSATAIDVTELKRAEQEWKRLEEQLRHSQKMEAVGQLAAGVAHEFNNLLVGIISNTELLFARSKDELPQGFKEPLEDIRRSGNRAAALTKQLLSFSKKTVSRVRVFDLNGLLDRTEHMLKQLVGLNTILEITRGPDPCLIRADESELEQVLANLVINARDAMPDGGTVTVRTTKVALDATMAPLNDGSLPPSHVELSVTDTGCGMSTETAERIFEPFFTTKPGSERTGLGLSTVFAIVKRSGGHISVDSRPDEGSLFRLCFPLGEAEIPDAPGVDGRKDEALTGTETILVCDDEEVVLRSLCWLLESGGYSVLAAESGQRALELTSSHEGPISILLTDVIMPEMNGRELAEELTRRRPDTKVIYMSGYASDVLEAGGNEGEAFEFLQKPSTSDALFECIRRVLDKPKGEAR